MGLAPAVARKPRGWPAADATGMAAVPELLGSEAPTTAARSVATSAAAGRWRCVAPCPAPSAWVGTDAIGAPSPGRRGGRVLAPGTGALAGSPLARGATGPPGAGPAASRWTAWPAGRVAGGSGGADRERSGSAVVSGRSGGTATDAVGTTPRVLTGAALAGSAKGATSSVATSAVHGDETSSAGRRWTGRCTSVEVLVSDETGRAGAATRPDGAIGLTSCPSASTIGGSGRAPGTPARNVEAGATTGGSPIDRWMGGREVQAPVGGAWSRSAGPASARPSGAPGRSATLGPPSASAAGSVSRLNGHGSRTVSRPRRGAC